MEFLEIDANLIDDELSESYEIKSLYPDREVLIVFQGFSENEITYNVVDKESREFLGYFLK